MANFKLTAFDNEAVKQRYKNVDCEISKLNSYLKEMNEGVSYLYSGWHGLARESFSKTMTSINLLYEILLKDYKELNKELYFAINTYSKADDEVKTITKKLK